MRPACIPHNLFLFRGRRLVASMLVELSVDAKDHVVDGLAGRRPGDKLSPAAGAEGGRRRNAGDLKRTLMMQHRPTPMLKS